MFKAVTLKRYTSSSTDKCMMTKKHFLLHKINAWLLGNQHCYFVLHYFYLSCVNFSSWTVVLLPDHLSGGLQFQCPASTLGLVWFKQTGSGLCEAIQTTIIVEGPISQVFLPPYFFFYTLKVIGLFLNIMIWCIMSFLL